MVTKYCKVFNAQINPNTSKLNNWSNQAKAIGKSNDKSYATSSFTKKKYLKSKATTKKDKNGKTVKVPAVYDFKYNHPYTVTAHEFALNIPSNAYLKSIKFQVRIKVDKNVTVLKPTARFCLYGTAWSKRYDDTKSKETGWENGLYYHYPKSNLSSSWSTITYTMDDATFKKGGFNVSNLNSTVMGVDLIFNDATFTGDKDATGNVYIAWVRVVVDYDMPEYTISYSESTSKLLPKRVTREKEFKVKCTVKNKTKSNGGTQKLNVSIPEGTELTAVSVTGGSYSKANNIWTWNAKGSSSSTLTLTLKTYINTRRNIAITNKSIGNALFYYQGIRGDGNDYEYVDISPITTEPHKRHKTCFEVDIHGFSDNEYVTYTAGSNKGFTGIGWTFVSASDGVSLIQSDNDEIVFKVPSKTWFDITVDYCYYPHSTGKQSFIFTSKDTNKSESYNFNVSDAYSYHIGSNVTGESNAVIGTAEIHIVHHRVASEVEADATVLECVSDDIDSVMIQSPCRINLYKWDELDYIGCVPLEQTHFDPKSTYKDTLFDTHYKNKRMMGKKLASDEVIDLNVRLHPHQVTTIQGLIDIDKPIPINTNHKSFESDALNHRGWAEIYGIKTSYTNPHWYKCEIDVKYLTHNLLSRFNIERGSKLNSFKLPSLLVESFASGSPLTSGDDEDDFFITETDGSYIYLDDETIVDDETGEIDIIEIDDAHRNLFSLANGQHINITSQKELSTVSQVIIDWTSTYNRETKENNLSRIIRLTDKNTNNIVFEYEYTDFIFDEYMVNCDLIGRRLVGDDTEVIISEPDVPLRYFGGDASSEDFDEEYFDDSSELSYGSTLHLQLEGNKLSVIEEGFNGKQYTRENIELTGNSYKLGIEWVNHNEDAETGDVECTFNITVQDTLYDSLYSNYYGDMIISPFPVADKKLLFTREAEEGTLYYYLDDNKKEEFSFLIDPYYQYMNGTDLVNDSGGSILSLNYGYKSFYIQNGLVRLGFNRINGQLYLGKYDTQAEEYITTQTFQLSKYDDINLKSISDDKIEIQASDSIFTIWRGHPYIMINHKEEDIQILTLFDKVWCEALGDDSPVDYPCIWDLMNNQNLLDECVGGNKTIKSSCVEVEEVDIASKNSTTLEWDSFPTSFELNTDIPFKLKGTSPVNEGVVILVNGEEWDEVTSNSFNLKFTENGDYTIQAVYKGNDSNNISFTKLETFTVRTDTVLPTTKESNGKYTLSFKNNKLTSVKYRDNTEVQFILKKGGSQVKGATVELVPPTGILSGITNKNGIVSFTNDKESYHAGSYKLGAYFVDSASKKKVAQVYKTIKITKSNPLITYTSDKIIKKGNNVVVKVTDNRKTPLVDTNVSYYLNGKKYTKKTNTKGNIHIKLENTGTYKFKVVFSGNKNLNSKTVSFTKKVNK